MKKEEEIERLKKLIADREAHIKSHEQQIKDNKVAIADAIAQLVRLGVCVTFKI